MLPSSKRHVSMRSSRAIQTLRCLKYMHPDEVAKLEFILVSEMSPLVKCYNNSMSISTDRQVDILYQDHALNLRKIARSQQSAYRNLLRVKNDMRRVHRESVIRHREKEVFDYQSARTARDRAEAEAKMMRLTLGKTTAGTDGGDWTSGGQATDINEAERSGWLRIRRRESSTVKNSLPTIQDIEDWETGSERRPETDDDDKAKDDGVRQDNAGTNNEGAIRNPVPHTKVSTTSSRQVDEKITLDFPNIKVDVDTPLWAMKTQEDNSTIEQGRKSIRSQPERARKPFSSRDGSIHRVKSFSVAGNYGRSDAGLGKSGPLLRVVTEKNPDNQNAEETDTLVDPVDEKEGETANHMNDTQGAKSGSDEEKTEGRKEPRKARVEWLVAPADTSDSASFRTGKSTDTSHRSSRGTSKPRGYVTGSLLGKDSDGTSTTTTKLEIKQKDSWGTTKRMLNLPELKLKPIKNVTRYRREADGQLVGTTASVQPSREKFQMPSKKTEYWRRRALQRQVEQFGSLDARVDEFLTDCDSISRPLPTLVNAPPLLLFSRHNPHFAPTSVSYSNSPFSMTSDGYSSLSGKGN